MPSQTIPANAPLPRVTGGQTNAGERDGDGHGHRQPDQHIERPARPIGDEHQAGRHQPAGDEGGTDQPKLELANPHAAESSGAHRKYGVAYDPRVIAAGPSLPWTSGTAAGWPMRGDHRDRGIVGHGRPGTARVTGTRGAVSPRLVLGHPRGAIRPRPWIRLSPVQDVGGDQGPARQAGPAPDRTGS